MLDAQKAAALSYTALSANASDVTRQSALSILSTSGLSVDFYPERLIACAFDCSSSGVSRISSEFEICVSMEQLMGGKLNFTSGLGDLCG